MPIERFSKEHEYVFVADDSDVGVVGITAHAAEQLGDIVFVQTPDVGQKVKSNEACAVVESVKAASDVFSPVSGEVIEINAALAEHPELVNEGAEAGGWFYKIRFADKAELDQLMDRAAYDTFAKESS